MKAGHTLIVFILDQSSSMNTVRDATISAFNEFIEDQRKQPGTAEVWLTRFATQVLRIDAGRTLDKIPPLTRETYAPEGLTALLDAVGASINAVGVDLAARDESLRPERVLVVIQTDGEENASKDYEQKTVFEMIEHQRTKYNWQFLFLGADQDAWRSAQKFGIDMNKTLSYSNNAGGVQASTRRLSDAVSLYRTTGVADLGGVDLRDDDDKT